MLLQSGLPSCWATWPATRKPSNITGAPASTPLNLWLNGALALISHAPCAPDCTATERLAGKILTALGRDHPGFEAIWLDHASRFHVLDVAGRSWALAVDEVAPNRYRVHDALLTTGGAPRAERRLADWRDAELFPETRVDRQRRAFAQGYVKAANVETDAATVLTVMALCDGSLDRLDRCQKLGA